MLVTSLATAPPGAADTFEWPGATPRDLSLANEILVLTRDALARLVPGLRPLGHVPVRVVVSDAPQVAGSSYVLPLREVRIERRFVNRMNLAHEATHALLHGRLATDPPVWLDEAAAQLVAYRVVHVADLAPPPGRPVGDFAALRALRGASWAAAGGAAYAESARWLGYLLPTGPATDEEKAAFASYVARLARGDGADAADAELAPIDRLAIR